VGVYEKINELPSIDSKVEKVKTKKSKELIGSKHQRKLYNGEENKRSERQHEYTNEENDEEHVDTLSNMATTLIEPEFVSFKNMKKNKRKHVCIVKILFTYFFFPLELNNLLIFRRIWIWEIYIS
jgi:hypothetical protein